MPDRPKLPAPPDARAGSPEIMAWMATLDHTNCRRDGEGTCWDIHCTSCGKGIGGGWAGCGRCRAEARNADV